MFFINCLLLNCRFSSKYTLQALSMERNPFSAQNQTLRSCRVYTSPTK